MSFSTGWRSMVGPKGMNPGQIEYWDDVFTKLSKTEEWNKYLEKENREKMFMNSKETKEYLDISYKEEKAILTELGMTKKQ